MIKEERQNKLRKLRVSKLKVKVNLISN